MYRLMDISLFPGITYAHLLEHMLFQGTEKYPSSDTFTSYLSEHAGKSNAHTAGEETVYYFDIMATHLKQILDIWCQFFICPLFNQEKTDLEIQAVDSENAKNLQVDVWRQNQLLRSRARPDHPFNQFGTGNKETLCAPKNLREILLDFHKKYYSPNIMKLVILGSEPLDKLEEWAREFFEPLPVNNNITSRPSIDPHPFTSPQLQKILRTVPVKDVEQMSLMWLLPSQDPLYHKKPANYLSHLIGHEAAGSILSLLKAKGWGNELSAGPYQPSSHFCLFKIDIDLTEDGLDHIEDIATIVFQYIDCIRKNGIQKWIFDETKSLDDIKFKFKNK
eukprot:TRINITY_DN9950_c0_g1_i2.p1 TRINITY_DN9950_c0_g1~~TRINITY_DN9950_c0_g1_i2.p1  ORF type:complete len:334 (+),score=76.57 TRINITY_DN9950_c0_g1_i2:333-1334(+)